MSAPLAHRTAHMQSSAIREILKITQRPEVISLAGGLPAPELFPLEALQRASDKVFRLHGPAAFQYSPTEGIMQLREAIAARLKFPAEPTEVLVTTGSQQGIFLVSQVLLDPGDYVVVESPTYLGALQSFGAHEARFLIADSDAEGIVPESLDEVLRTAPVKPKLIYLIPNHQNPSGVTLSAERRPQVAAIAERHDVLILEDDPYGELTFSGPMLPPLRSYSASHVIYLGSFSKIFAPGLRTAYTVAPPEVFAYLVKTKQAADLHTGSLDQYLAFETFGELDMPSHLARLRATYGERCQALLEALGRHFPAEATWTRPRGGMFIWVRLNLPISTHELLDRAVAHEVAYVPGVSFTPDGGITDAMRLNFSNVAPARLEEGVRRLASLVKAAVAV